MKSYLERAEGYLEHLQNPKWVTGVELTEEEKLEVQTTITVTSLMAVLSVASSLEDVVQVLQEQAIPKLVDIINYQALLEKYMAGVIDAESVSFSANAKDLTPDEESILEDLAKKLGCGHQR